MSGNNKEFWSEGRGIFQSNMKIGVQIEHNTKSLDQNRQPVYSGGLRGYTAVNRNLLAGWMDSHVKISDSFVEFWTYSLTNTSQSFAAETTVRYYELSQTTIRTVYIVIMNLASCFFY